MRDSRWQFTNSLQYKICFFVQNLTRMWLKLLRINVCRRAAFVDYFHLCHWHWWYCHNMAIACMYFYIMMPIYSSDFWLTLSIIFVFCLIKIWHLVLMNVVQFIQSQNSLWCSVSYKFCLPLRLDTCDWCNPIYFFFRMVRLTTTLKT